MLLELELVDGDDELSIDSGLDWGFLGGGIEVPVAWTAEASGEAGDLICWLCIDTRFLGSFLEALGESWKDEAVVGVAGFEVEEGLLPIVWRGGRGGKDFPLLQWLVVGASLFFACSYPILS